MSGMAWCSPPGEVNVVVESTRDDRDADRGPLQAGQHLLVATELDDVPTIAEVPLGRLPTVADGLLRLGRPGARGPCGPSPPLRRLARPSTCPGGRSPSSRAARLSARARRPIVWRASVTREAGRASDTATPIRGPDHGVEGTLPAVALLAAGDRRQDHERADRHLRGRWTGQAQEQLGDGQRQAGEQSDRPHVEADGVADGDAPRTRRARPRRCAGRRVRTDARTDTWTVTSAASGASTGSGTSVSSAATHQASAAARPALATRPISVDVGGVHDTRRANDHHRRRRRWPATVAGCDGQRDQPARLRRARPALRAARDIARTGGASRLGIRSGHRGGARARRAGRIGAGVPRTGW